MIGICVIVSLSVSVCHKSEFYRNGWTDRADFGADFFLHCVTRTFAYLRNGLSLGNFVLNSVFTSIHHVMSIVAMCCQLSLTMVLAEYV